MVRKFDEKCSGYSGVSRQNPELRMLKKSKNDLYALFPEEVARQQCKKNKVVFFSAAANGKEAVEVVEKALGANEPYDLVCLDIMMPEMDGQEALRKIREFEEARGTMSTEGMKIVMTTALDDVKSVSSAYENLCDGYLVKPIDKQKLVAQLRELQLVS